MSRAPVLEFCARAAENPDSEAVRGEYPWTYGEIARLANAVASYLRRSGFQRGDRAALALANCPEFVALYFGIQLAGGAVVPLNALDRPRTQVHQTAHCGARFVFVNETQRETFESLGAGGATAVAVNVNGANLNARSHAANDAWSAICSSAEELSAEWPVNVSDLALILYTSGTTGKPKGVMLSHNNLFANMWSIFGSLPILRTDRCLVVLPFYHSFGNSLLTTHLSSGASLVLQNNIAFPHHVLKRIESDRITSLYGVPLTFSLLLGKPVPSDIDISSLRYMAQAGGAMYKRQVRQLKRDVPHIDLFVMYGQTEATARLACVPVEMLEKKLGSAGRPVRGVEIEIRDGQGNYVPTGGAGEIWVRGDSVMLGYWGDPEGSANVLQRGWLWTRDRGRLDEDGFLYLEGRSDEIIKTGANRVNPEEVEEVISMLEGVKEVGVVGIPDAVLGQAVFAAVVPNAGAHFSEKSVRAHCLHLLAPYKVPKRVMLIDRLPRTSSGKIRRRELAHVVGGADDGGNKW